MSEHMAENDAPACACDLRFEAPEWWAATPGLHHLEGCPMRPTSPGKGGAS